VWKSLKKVKSHLGRARKEVFRIFLEYL